MSHSLPLINESIKQTPTLVMDAGNKMAYELMQLSDIMQSSQGRDKICAFIQYSAELYVRCMKSSPEYKDQVV